jgi:hypothetical protein
MEEASLAGFTANTSWQARPEGERVKKVVYRKMDISEMDISEFRYI